MLISKLNHGEPPGGGGENLVQKVPSLPYSTRSWERGWLNLKDESLNKFWSLDLAVCSCV